MKVLTELTHRLFSQMWKTLAELLKMWCHCYTLRLIRISQAIFMLGLTAIGACAPKFIACVITFEQDLPVRRAIYTESPVAFDAAYKS